MKNKRLWFFTLVIPALLVSIAFLYYLLIRPFSALPFVKTNGAAHAVKIILKTKVSRQLPIVMTPSVKKIDIFPGKTAQVFFHLMNYSGRLVSVSIYPSISPKKWAQHLRRLNCFFMKKQILYPGEVADIPLTFHVNPSMPAFIREMVVTYTVHSLKGHFGD